MKNTSFRLWMFIFLALAVAVPASAQVGERPRETDNTRAAERALDDAEDTEDPAERQAHYEAAMSGARAAMTENENNPLGYRLAALASLGLGQYGEAGEYIDRAIELYPLYEVELQPLREQTWIDLYNRAMPFVNSGDYESATVIFEDAHAIYTGRPEAMITLAQLHASTGEYERSIELMEAYDVFIASETVANFDSATVAGWQSQASVLPELRAQVLSASGRFDEAADAYRALSEADPNELEYVRGLASVLMDAGDEEEALVVYEQLLSAPGLSGSDLYAIGIAFYNVSNYVNAATAFEGAAEQSPNNRDALEFWVRSLALDSIYADIPDIAQRWIDLDPYSQNAYVLMAQAANQNGDAETTQSAMARVQELEVAVDQLQFRPFGGGGGSVDGSVINKTLEEGASVTLRFTFYGASGAPIGTVTETVTVGAADMAQLFSVQLDSAEEVGGYGYELTIG